MKEQRRTLAHTSRLVYTPVRIRTFLFVLLTAILEIAFATPPTTGSERAYIWHLEGLTVYAQPSAASPALFHIPYAEPISIMDGEKHTLNAFLLDTSQTSKRTVAAYEQSSTWLKISYKNKVGYLPNTHLVRFPPPGPAHDLGFIMEDYLRELSPVLWETNEGKTDSTCARYESHFLNGMRYRATDYGPCEQCGHYQQQLVLPEISLQEGFAIALHLFHRSSLLKPGAEVVISSDGTVWELNGISPYGHIHQIRITPQSGAIRFTYDTYL